MKKIHTLIPAILIALAGIVGCSSNKNSVVINATPAFEQNVEWQLVSIKNKKVYYEEEQPHATIVFNPETGQIAGISGCNHYFASYRDLGNGKIEFGVIGSTKMACPEAFMRLENNYYNTLAKVDGYRLGEYTLELLSGETVVLTYDKSETTK